jgi:hypothetical protein
MLLEKRIKFVFTFLIGISFFFGSFSVNVLSQENGLEFPLENQIEIVHYYDDGFDANENGYYDALGVAFIVNVSSPGYYVIEGQNLVDVHGNILNVSAGDTLFLEAGEQIVSLFFEGRQIYSYGLNPVNISYIGIFSEDYSKAGFVYNLQLSREYTFSEFEPPPDYDVGVKTGDWVKYNVTSIVTEFAPFSDVPIIQNNEITIEVKKVENQLVSIETRFIYEAGIQKSETEGYLEEESQIYPLIIPANLNVGDMLGQYSESTIDGSLLENILGNERELNFHKDTSDMFQENMLVTLDQDLYWDKSTGILIKSWFNMTMNDILAGATSFNNFSFTIISSNVIRQKTSLVIDAPSEIKLGETITVEADLRDYSNEGMRGEKIILMSENDNKLIGESTTNSNGRVEFEFKPSGRGEHLLKAIFDGSDEYLPAENSLEVKVSGGSTFNFLPWAIAIIVGVIVLIIFRHKLF